MKKTGSLAAVLCAALILTGCRYFPSVPSSGEPDTTPSHATDTSPVTDDAQTTAPVTEREPFWEASATLVENGALTLTVVSGENAADSAALLIASLPQGVTSGEVQSPELFSGDGRLLLSLTADGEPDAYSVRVDADGLVLSANSEEALTCAVRSFCAVLAENLTDGVCRAELSRLTVENRPLLPVPQGTDTPEPVSSAFSCRTYAFSEVGEGDYAQFESALLSAGFAKSAENRIGENRFVTYLCDSHAVSLAYFPADGTLTAVYDPTSPAVSEQSAEWDKVADTSLTQLGCAYEVGNFGMGYLITLEDGSYIVIDGGTDEPDAAGKTAHERLYELMVANNRRADKTVLIRAWFLTNGKYDHATLAKRFFMEYGDRVTLELLALNFHPTVGTTTEKEVRTAARLCGEGAEIRILHTGQSLTFCGVTVESLYTADLTAGDGEISEDDTSMILRITAKGQTVLFCSDMGEKTAQSLTRRYGDTLKCDLLQIPSHGETDAVSESVLTEFYRSADPEIILWPHADANIEQLRALPANDYLLNQLHVKSVITGSDTPTGLKLPYVGA